MIILDNSENYPKTLLIRNEKGGMVWQVYHVNNIREAKMLARTAQGNRFDHITLEAYDKDAKETWPGWRNLEGWKLRWSNKQYKHPPQLVELDQKKNYEVFGNLEIFLFPGIYRALWCGYSLQFIKQSVPEIWPYQFGKDVTLCEMFITEGIRGMSMVDIQVTVKGQLFILE